MKRIKEWMNYRWTNGKQLVFSCFFLSAFIRWFPSGLRGTHMFSHLQSQQVPRNGFRTPLDCRGKNSLKLLYFVWSPPWHLYMLLLANLLAFYLTYLLAFYLAYLLAFYLAYLLAYYLLKSSGILSGKHSGTLSGISSGILSDILSGILSGIPSGISSNILSGISPGTLSGIS